MRKFFKATKRRLRDKDCPPASALQPIHASSSSSPTPYDTSLNDTSPPTISSSAVDSGVPSVQSVTHPVSPASQPHLTASSIPTSSPEARPRAETQSMTWLALKSLSRSLNNGAEAFGPLKLAVGELLECVDIFESAAQGRQDYEALEMELNTLFHSLEEWLSGTTPVQMTASITNLSNEIRKEIDFVRKKSERSTMQRYAQAKEDRDDVLECYQRIQRLLSQISVNTDLNIWKIVDVQLAETRLERIPTVRPARFNSSESTMLFRGKCTPNTRTQVLGGLHDWLNNPNGEHVYWLTGMAGTGKTTIAYTFCAELEVAHSLGASFFCSRALSECRNVALIIPTIAYQLALFSYPFRSVLCQLLGDELDICNRDIPTQFERMIVDTLTKIRNSVPQNTVVVIDALDECVNQHEVGLFLGSLLKHASQLPIRFFIASRAESAIQLPMTRSPAQRSVFYLHEVEESFIREDIELFVKEELSPISPSLDQISELVKQAGRLFIYASTVIRYVKRDGFDDYSLDRLDSLLQLSKHNGKIDDLYTTILSAAFQKPDLEEQEKADMLAVLHAVVCAREPLTVDALGALLRPRRPRVIRTALQPFHSVLHVSHTNNLVNPLHASFPDYLCSRARSGAFYCDKQLENSQLARLCFSRIGSIDPPFNICALESSYVLDKDVQDLSERVKQTITPDLLYACRCWFDHISLGQDSESQQLSELLNTFLSERLLLWMEILNLKGVMNLGPQILSQAERWIKNHDCPEHLKDLCYDALNFVSVYASSPASLSTPHIYVSALAFWPTQAPISRCYTPRMCGLIEISGKPAKGNTALLARWSAPNRVSSLAVSPDGTRLLSGLQGNLVCIWDIHTGQKLVGPLKGHKSGAFAVAVAYSADSTHIASGSRDGTVCIWDAHTGRMLFGPLNGHKSDVNSIVFSPNGSHVISGSRDRTIRVWNLSDGQTTQILEEHNAPIWSVAYSSDGTRMASGSEDKTVCIWDVHTGRLLLRPLEGHKDTVSSVAFSPDSSRVVSGSWDHTVLVWDMKKGERVFGPLEGHSYAIFSVAYSAQGDKIASGGMDYAICVWDAHTGDLLARHLRGHTGMVNSISFSIDGTRIISGADDFTICTWDAYIQTETALDFKGHSGHVNSVKYSPDGSCIVTASDDKTVGVWDAQTGQNIVGPIKGHTDIVYSVACSPDGRHIASGSGDNTICIWDMRSGAKVAGPFNGHTDAVMSLQYSRDGTRILSGSHDGNICIWDVLSGQMVASPLRGHTDAVLSVSFSPDGMRFVSGSKDTTVCFWDVNTMERVAGPFRGHLQPVATTAYSPDGTRILTSSWDSTMCLWDAHTGRRLAGFLQRSSRIYAAAFSSDGSRIVSGGSANALCLWDADFGLQMAEPFEGHTGPICSIAYSPDGAYIATGSGDNTIRVWRSDILESSSAPWELNGDGWAVDNSHQLLAWVPSDSRTALLLPYNAFIVCSQEAIQMSFDNARLGRSWAEMYKPT